MLKFCFFLRHTAHVAHQAHGWFSKFCFEKSHFLVQKRPETHRNNQEELGNARWLVGKLRCWINFFWGAEICVPDVCTCGTSGTLAIFEKKIENLRFFRIFVEFQNFSKNFPNIFLSKIDKTSSHFDNMLVWTKSKQNTSF